MTNNLIAAAGEIVNPVVTGLGSGGNNASGANVAFLIGTFIKVMVIVGTLGFILYFLLGTSKWIMSGGDKGHLEEAKHEIVNAVTGLVIMLALYAIIAFLNNIFGIDILKINWPTPTP